MKIGLGNNNATVQSKIGQESVRKTDVQESKKNSAKNKLDSNEISTGRSTSFDDSRISVAKSAILYDVTVKDSDRLSELKEAVKNGTYHVPTETLVDALLK